MQPDLEFSYFFELLYNQKESALSFSRSSVIITGLIVLFLQLDPTLLAVGRAAVLMEGRLDTSDPPLPGLAVLSTVLVSVHFILVAKREISLARYFQNVTQSSRSLKSPARPARRGSQPSLPFGSSWSGCFGLSLLGWQPSLQSPEPRTWSAPSPPELPANFHNSFHVLTKTESTNKIAKQYIARFFEFYLLEVPFSHTICIFVSVEC